MKIYDCFMYFDEEVVVDVRLHTLNEFVDYFVIVESRFTHKGTQRELRFNHKKFEKCQPPSFIIFMLVNLVLEKKVSILKKEYFLSFIFLNH